MNKAFQSISILSLLALAACASDEASGTGSPDFVADGPEAVVREPMVAFLRWQLHDDPNGAFWFVGDACGLCTDTSWSFDTQ